jgi:hypothetical protein
MLPLYPLILLAPFLVASLSAVPLPAPVFQTAEELTGNTVNLFSVSKNGSVYSGTFLHEGKAAAYRYSAQDGFQILATDLPADTEGVWQAGMSDEGRLVYGHLQYDAGGVTYLEGFVWTTTGGFQRLGQIGGGSYSVAHSVTANNKVVGGQYRTEGGQHEAFLWTERDGIRSLASIFPDYPAAGKNPEWINNKRTVVWAVGYANGYTAMLWMKGKGAITFADLPGGRDSLSLEAIIPNGRLAFGYGSSVTGYESVSFRTDGRVERLFPDADFQTIALAAALGGRVVAGVVDSDLGQNFTTDDNFFLDRKTGKLTYLSDLLSTWVPEAAGWTGMTVVGISANGDVVIGNGWDGSNVSRFWALRGVKKLITGKPLN